MEVMLVALGLGSRPCNTTCFRPEQLPIWGCRSAEINWISRKVIKVLFIRIVVVIILRQKGLEFSLFRNRMAYSKPRHANDLRGRRFKSRIIVPEDDKDLASTPTRISHFSASLLIISESLSSSSRPRKSPFRSEARQSQPRLEESLMRSFVAHQLISNQRLITSRRSVAGI